MISKTDADLPPAFNRDNLSASTLLLLLLGAYIALVPSIDLIPVLGRYDEKRLLECILLLLAGFCLIIQAKLRQNWILLTQQLSSHTRLLMAGVLTLGLLSAAQATAPDRAILDISLYVLLFIGCLLIALQRQLQPQFFDALLLKALLFSSAFSLLAFFSAFIAAQIEPVPLLHWDLFVNFSHIRFFSQFQSWTLPLIVLPLLLSRTTPKGLQLWLPLLLASGWWFLLFSSGTRGTMLGLIIATIVTALTFGRHALPWFKWQGLALLTGLALYILLFLLPPLLSAADTSAIQNGTIGRALSNSSGRFHLWQVALSMITEHPWLGVGPMHYACGVTNGIGAHPHNSLLQIAAEWGLPVALIVVIIALRGALAWIRLGRVRLRQTDGCGTIHPLLFPALLASLITGSTHALFSGVIIMPLSQITMILVFGWMLGIYFSTAPMTPKHGITAKNQLLWLLLPLLASTGLLAGIAPDLLHFGELLNTTHVPAEATHYMPRFWQQGLICG